MCQHNCGTRLWVSRNFLVYEHWRPDTGVCFYVGKGKLRRARSFEARNNLHGKVVAKLRRAGAAPEVRIVQDNLTASEAFYLEIKRIAYWRGAGVKIANFTDGGDGTIGWRHTEAAKEKMRARALGRKMPEEQRQRLIIDLTGRKHSVETRAKQSASAKIAQKLRFERVKATPEGRAALSFAMTMISRKRRRSCQTAGV